MNNKIEKREKICVSWLPKPTISLDDSLEGFTRLRKAVILMITVYYRKEYRLKSAKGKSK